MRMLWIVAIVAAAFSLDAGRGAHAQWCAQYDEYTSNCGFRTFQQCLETISGVGGFCRQDRRAPSRSRLDEEREEERRRQRAPRW